MISNNYKIKVIFTLLLSGIILTANNAVAGEFAIMIKSGIARVADDTQVLDGQTRTFDEDSEKTLSVAWEIRNERNVGLGMEYMTYEHDFTSPSPIEDGYTKTQLYMFSARKYFAVTEILRPYAGIGLGWGYTKFNRNLDVDRDWNTVMQVSGGLELRLAKEFGIYGEVKGLMSGADSRDNEFDFSGPAFMTGVSFIF